MSLKSVLDAQKSGGLDLLPSSAFNHPSPLTIRIEDGAAYADVMVDGYEWYYAEIDQELIIEALQLVGIKQSDVKIMNTQVVDNKTKNILFSGEDIADLFADIVCDAGIYTERH
jgi:hypothetical protein